VDRHKLPFFFYDIITQIRTILTELRDIVTSAEMLTVKMSNDGEKREFRRDVVVCRPCCWSIQSTDRLMRDRETEMNWTELNCSSSFVYTVRATQLNFDISVQFSAFLSPGTPHASSGQLLPTVWQYRRSLLTLGKRAFPVFGANQGNGLPFYITSAPTVSVIRPPCFVFYIRSYLFDTLLVQWVPAKAGT